MTEERELTDEEVMTPPAEREMSDEEVMKPPSKPSFLSSMWERGKVRPTTLTMDSSLRTAPYVKEVMGAFGTGFEEGYGEHLDFTKGLIKEYGKPGPYRLFGKDGEGQNPFEAMNEILAHAIVGTAETALRIGGGLFRGAQSSVFEATGSRDLAAIPEAFFGTPHPFGIKPPAPLERVSAGTHIAGGLLKEEGVTAAELRGASGIEAYHGSPHDFEAFDISKIGTGEGAQSYGHGLYFAEHPEVAQSYKDMVPKAIPPGWSAEQTSRGPGQFENRWKVTSPDGKTFNTSGMRNEQDAIRQVMTPPEGSLYKVRILADREHFLDYEKPLGEQAPTVRAAMEKLGAREGETGAAFYDRLQEEILPQVEMLKPTNPLTDAEFFAKRGKLASDALREAGVPGIKYLDQGSRAGPRPKSEIEADLQRAQRDAASYQETIDNLKRAGHGPGDLQNRLSMEMAKVNMLTKELAGEKPTSNFVVFDDKSVEITHKNGEALTKAERADLVREPQKPIDIDQARDLGVVGPERPSINDGTAKEAAEAATKSVADAGKLEEKTPSLPDDGWQARFDQFVGKLEAPKDVRRLIRNAASENENFPAARQGSIPLQHVEDIAAAAGVEPGEVNVRGLGRTLRNDQEVRVAMRLMMQGTDNVKSLARDVVADASEQNLIKFQEAILRRDMAVEQIVGLRAEWGRTGNVFQEFMREVKDGEALDSFLKDKCPL